MSYKLSNLKINRVSLVDFPASVDKESGFGAHVELFKSESAGGDEMSFVKVGEKVTKASVGLSKAASIAAIVEAAKGFTASELVDLFRLRPDLHATWERDARLTTVRPDYDTSH